MEPSESLFECYHDEFSSLVRELQSQSSLSNDSDNDVLQHCEHLLQQMTIEARSASDSKIKKERMDRARACKRQLQALKLDCEKKEIMANSSARTAPASQAENMLERQNETLERARQTIEETEAVGTEITKELENNRSTMESTQRQIQEVSSMTERAGNILKSMSKPWWHP